MVCKKLKIYNNLRVILDNYERYIDFKYRAVSNIWPSVDIEDKLTYGEYYKYDVIYINWQRVVKP